MTAEAWELAAAFVAVRIDAMESVALAVQKIRPGPWAARLHRDQGMEIYSYSREKEKGDESLIFPDAWLMEATQHVVLHGPDHVLRRVASDRRVLARCRAVLKASSHHTTVESCDEDEAVLAQEILYDLASSWDTHPDYPVATP